MQLQSWILRLLSSHQELGQLGIQVSYLLLFLLLFKRLSNEQFTVCGRKLSTSFFSETKQPVSRTTWIRMRIHPRRPMSTTARRFAASWPQQEDSRKISRHSRSWRSTQMNTWNTKAECDPSSTSGCWQLPSSFSSADRLFVILCCVLAFLLSCLTEQINSVHETKVYQHTNIIFLLTFLP